MTSLFANIYHFQRILSVLIQHLSTFRDGTSLLNAWLSSGVLSRLPPTWRNLLLIIRLLKLDELAQRMETCLMISGATATEEQHHIMRTTESEGE